MTLCVIYIYIYVCSCFYLWRRFDSPPELGRCFPPICWHFGFGFTSPAHVIQAGQEIFNDQVKVREAFWRAGNTHSIWLDDLGLAYLW